MNGSLIVIALFILLILVLVIGWRWYNYNINRNDCLQIDIYNVTECMQTRGLE